MPARARGGSADRFRALVDSIKDYAIFMLDARGRVLTWNLGAHLIKGYTASEIIGRHIETFYTDGDRARGRPAELLAEAAADGRVEDEGWRVRKDGSRFWADVVITALRDEAGELTGFAKITRDLSDRRRADEERKRREEELLRSEERFQLLLEAVSDYAIFMLDPDGVITTWNAGAQRIKGYAAREIIGQHFSVFRLEEDIRDGKPEQELAIAARDGRIEEEGWRLRKDGSKFWANVVLSAIYDRSGVLIGFAKITRDLTDRQRLDDERVKRAGAEEAVRTRDEFLSIASHELRTPLTAIQIELHALQDAANKADPRLAKRLARAARNADRLAALVESLMDVSRLASGRLALKPERMDLVPVLAQLVDSLHGSAAKARCEISFGATGSVWGAWDRLRLEQIVMNVIGNALKYGAGAPVRVSLAAAADHAVIEVADGGPGIPEADLARIFGRFERAVSPRHYGGLGLGLYVSRQLVEAMGGAIDARNLPAGGACFSIRLPRPESASASSSDNIASS
jgi:PAS domain S-box-containing protein